MRDYGPLTSELIDMAGKGATALLVIAGVIAVVGLWLWRMGEWKDES